MLLLPHPLPPCLSPQLVLFPLASPLLLSARQKGRHIEGRALPPPLVPPSCKKAYFSVMDEPGADAADDGDASGSGAGGGATGEGGATAAGRESPEHEAAASGSGGGGGALPSELLSPSSGPLSPPLSACGPDDSSALQPPSLRLGTPPPVEEEAAAAASALPVPLAPQLGPPLRPAGGQLAAPAALPPPPPSSSSLPRSSLSASLAAAAAATGRPPPGGGSGGFDAAGASAAQRADSASAAQRAATTSARASAVTALMVRGGLQPDVFQEPPSSVFCMCGRRDRWALTFLDVLLTPKPHIPYPLVPA